MAVKKDIKSTKKKSTAAKKPSAKSNYHHGNLQETLINAATKMLEQGGIDNLSLRKLAESVGVSRTAAYHHFTDKNDLLCAVAAQGFVQWRATEQAVFADQSLSMEQKYKKFFLSYITFAADNPSLYDLMFGHTIWKEDKSTQTLKDVAYPSFQYQVDMTKTWQEQGLLPSGEKTLRLAQVTWGTMHGIARLLIDGIYADISHIEEMCDCAVSVFLAQKSV